MLGSNVSFQEFIKVEPGVVERFVVVLEPADE
jgi:hypothetical protein